MDCLIIAAGKGSRLNGVDKPKPLVSINNKALIEYIIDNVISIGIERIFVVTGYESEQIIKQLECYNKTKKAEIISLYNPHWEESNGLSVLAAKNKIKAPFLLLMSDHLFIPSMLEQLTSSSLKQNETILGVDLFIENNPLVDLDDVTRVKIKGDTIQGIGKHLKEYNAFDTGMFYSSSYLFDAIEIAKEEGDSSLSAGMRILLDKSLAKVRVIKQARWIDVDTPQMLNLAKELIDKDLL
ncbi:MAG: NTP transferase domain-containing protein [Pseudomonadota bacterium]